MTITVADPKLLQSERMTDNADGGGRMTANAIVSGSENRIFDDVTDVDRAAGDVSIRKVYGAVASANTDKYLDAGAVVFKAPDDPAVSVLAFSTGDFYDQRADLKARIEQTVVRGSRWNGWLWGQHLVGQRAVTLWQRPENERPTVGGRIEAVARAAGVEQYSQFLWITRVGDTLRVLYDDKGSYTIREVTCEIAEPLAAAYTGPEPSRTDPSLTTATALVYQTRYNPNAVPLYGVRPTVETATTGDFSVKIDSLYSPIIPTALTETALADVNPGGDSPALISGNSTAISFATPTQSVKPNVALYCGTGILPGTLSIAVSGSTIVDAGGKALLGGAQVGTVDYGNGIVTWNDACPNYGTATKTVTFRPAARPLKVADSAYQTVTLENRGYVWTIALTPIPAPGTLRVSYRVNNQWYVLADDGSGQVTGADSSYGTGTLNFSTGTVTLTTGALPDVGSPILYVWGTPTQYTARGGSAVAAPVARGTVAHTPVARLTVSVSWTVGATTYTVDDTPAGDGLLTGTGGDGGIDYASGVWWVRPTTLPPVGTVFSVNYQYGTVAAVVQTFTGLVADGAGMVRLTLSGTDVLPGSVLVSWTPPSSTYWWLPKPCTIVLRDTGTSTLSGPFRVVIDPAIVESDAPHSIAVDYVAGTIDVPVTISSGVTWTRSRIVWGWAWCGSVYRYCIVGFLQSPYSGTITTIDASTVVTVKYTPAGTLTAASETVALDQLELDLTPGFAETITAGSARFLLGGSVYVDVSGQLYRDPGTDTGAGTLCGTLDRESGVARINAWTSGGANGVTLRSLVTELSAHAVDAVTFRAPTSPLRSGSLQIRYQQIDGAVKVKTVDATGLLSDADCTIRVDYPLGVVQARFGLYKADADLTPTEKLEDWYDPDVRETIGGVLSIWKPASVLADSILYNAVAQTTLPPDSALLGIDAARLPPDGKALIFNAGWLALVHHTARMTPTALSPTQVIDCGRVRLYRVAIEDAGGLRLPDAFFSVNREAGTVTMAADLNLTGYTGPYTVIHTVGDLARLTAVDINGTLSLNKALSHTFPANESRVSGVLYVGTLQARVANLFAQSTWTSVWSDSRIGSAPLAQYNDTTWPVVVSNAGAYPDRILVQFTSSTAFNVIGEHLGVIGSGTTAVDCAPVNTLTGQPYFTIRYQGWGTGWATGNCLRFNVIGAAFPVDLIRAVQPSSPTGTDPDSVELLLIGNVDA